MPQPPNKNAATRERLLLTLQFAEEVAGLSAALAANARSVIERAFSHGGAQAIRDSVEFIDDLSFTPVQRIELHRRLQEAGLAEAQSPPDPAERVAQRVLDRGRVRSVKEYQALLEAVDRWVQDDCRTADVERINLLLVAFELQRRGSDL